MSPLFLYGLSAVLHCYVGARLVPDLATPWGVALALLLAASALLMPMGMLAWRFIRGAWAERVAIAGLFAMGLFSSLLVATFLRDVVLIALGVVHTMTPLLFSYERLASVSAGVVPVAAIAVTAIGLWNARRIARIVEVDVPIAGLPGALDGFTIAQISDVHVGPTIRRNYVEGIVDAVNALEADLIAITGDLVDGSVPQLREHVAPLANLRAKHGRFFVTGNHEYYAGALPWMEELERLGIRVLHNEHVVLDHGAARLVVAGVPDYSAGHFHPAHASDPAAALAGAPPDARARILLAHQPRTAPAAAKAGFDLQLSGHTHGGQFWPWNHFVRFQQPFTAGLNRMDGLWVYVSRGTGYWGPPKRFGAPSEITKLRLKPA
ncbi:MAG TPA: metallophosphoesterase [Ramlibacter sp.]|nr:metallophosphoesterase [Ramlibacter sp.]